MAATLKDVAKLCAVHPSTVSRVIRGKENIPISPETREKILEAVKNLNYQPDQTARALRLKKSNVIGLIIPNFSSPYFSSIAKIMELECSKQGYTLIVCDTNEEQEKEIRAVNDLSSRGVDGLIIAPVQECDYHIRELAIKKFPFVLIDRCFDNIETNAVICNDEESAYNAVVHLINLGHKKIGFISGRPNLYPVIKRLSGYKKALQDHDLALQEKYIAGVNPTLEDAFNSAQLLLNLPVAPSALIISGSIITLGVLKAIIEKKLAIPKDISIIGFTDTIYSPYLICPLTTVTHSIKEIGTKAFELLLHNIINEDNPSHSKVTIRAEFFIRGSTTQNNSN